MKSLVTICALTALILTVNGTAQAIPTVVSYVDGRQDSLWVPPLVHELGNPPAFPQDESISSAQVPWIGHFPCPLNWEGSGATFQVSITNLTGSAWSDLWYVADSETYLTNDDGWINGGLAFKIDNIGANTPLVAEIGGVVPLVFEPGETWEFVIQDFVNAADDSLYIFDSQGVPSPIFVPGISSGSIIAIPAPGAIMLGGIGVGLVGWLRRRKTL